MANKDSSKPKKRMSKKASLGLEGSRSKPQKENMPIEAATVKIQSPKQEQIRSAPLTGKKAISKAQNQTGDLGVPEGVKRKGSPLSAAVGPDTCLKRQKSPGVRIIGGRVYDSENGQTCHQCRQKTIEFMAPCKNTSGDKVCTQKFCPKCLLNRYGENVAEAFELVDWFCPRCRGICNCSICMKKKGCTPTGILTHTAKATGFGSVADFLKQASQKSMTNSFIPEILPKNKSSLSQSDQQVNETRKKLKSKSNLKGSSNQQFQASMPNSGAEQCADKQKDHQVKGTKKKQKAKELPKGSLGEHSHSAFATKSSSETMIKVNVTKAVKQENGLVSKHGLEKRRSVSIGSERGDSIIKKKSAATAPRKNKHMPALGGNCKSDLAEMKPCINANRSVVEVFIPVTLCMDDKKTEAGERVKEAQNPCKQSRTTLHHYMPKVEHSPIEFTEAEGVLSTRKQQTFPGKDHLVSDIDRRTEHCDITFKEEIQTGAGVPYASEAECCSQSPKVPKVKSHKVKALKPKIAEQEILLPESDQLVAVAGIELPGNAIGSALQLLEFCSAFQEPLGLKRGQAENILRELTRGGVTRRGTQSQLVQLHVKLLSLIQEEDEEPSKITSSTIGKNSWLRVFKKHLLQRLWLFTKVNKDLVQSAMVDCCTGSSESASPLRLSSEIIAPMSEEDQLFILKSLDDGNDGYTNLDIRTRLWLLNILCDDSLCTSSFRGYIEDAITKYEEKQKEKREEVLAAKKEAKEANQKKKDAEVKRLLAMENVEHTPLSLDEQSALLAKVKQEAEKADAARLALSQVASRLSSHRHDALRTEPITLDKHGRAFWRLKGAEGGARVLLQDITNTQSGAAVETWSIYSKEQEQLLVKYITSTRLRKSRKKPQGQKQGEESSDEVSDTPMQGANSPYNSMEAECKDGLSIPEAQFTDVEFSHIRMQDESHEAERSEENPKASKLAL